MMEGLFLQNLQDIRLLNGIGFLAFNFGSFAANSVTYLLFLLV